MKKIAVLIFLLLQWIALAQGEANIWYFGKYAGLDFSSGSPLALTNGQLNTNEGCAVLSNNLGQLLFYTDGVTVYNRNHQIMLNGTGLMGNSSTTQSATIVQKPGATNLYYVFTIDVEGGGNGVRYSIVDLNLDGGLGGVITSEKNILIYAPSCEKLAVVKQSNNIDYWIMTHDYNSDAIICNQLTSSGLNVIPVINHIGSFISNSSPYNTMGYMKISPNGSKLAVCNTFVNNVQLFDFNNTTGVVSNPITIISNNMQLYGAEFSPNNEILYVSQAILSKIFQFNLSSADIPNSVIEMNCPSINAGALQLGPDNKIYIAGYGSNKISVINNPNIVGLGCDMQLNAIDLAGKTSYSGLPSFCQSYFFTPAIQFNTPCEGDSTNFSFNTNQTILSASWNFGDGNTTTAISPSHTYSTAGTYPVSVNITTPNGTISNNTTAVVNPLPTILNPTITLKQCDDNLDGISAFNLNEAIPLLVTNPTGLTISFHETLTEAQNKTNAITPTTNYLNQMVSNDVIYARIENSSGCYTTVTVNLHVSTTNIPGSFQIIQNQCDDTASGSDTDGIATFDFSSADAQIRALFPVGQLLTITYYKNITDALAETNTITNTTNYTNTDSPTTQNIYVRVDSQTNNECLALGHHVTLKVDRIPTVQPQTIRHCDDNHDGIFAFNTATLQNTLLNGITNVVVTYTNQAGNPVILTNPFVSTSQTLTATVKNTFGKQCQYSTTVQFIVDELPTANPIASNWTTQCDDESYPTPANGTFPFNTATFDNAIIGTQTNMHINYFDANNNPLPSPLPNPFLTATQTIRAEVINNNNPNCSTSVTIPFVVKPVPQIQPTGLELVCSDNLNFTKTIDAGLLNPATQANFSYAWFKDGVAISSATGYSLVINSPGTYTVTVSNANGCDKTRTITALASNTATIESVVVTDLTEENSIIVTVNGGGIYAYSLDNQTYQDSPVFQNVLSGVYTVYVKDKNGCGITTQEVTVLGIPKYFTPNADGYNDYWNIKGISEKQNSKSQIKIFDRFGKLIKQISPNGQGWDGTFNNQILPADDYWYTIELEDGRLLKGHFALKR